MTLQRLLDGSGDDFDGALLRSAQADLPSDAEVRRGIAALAAASGTLAASAAAASAGVTAGSAVGTATPAHGVIGGTIVAKWLGIGFIAGAVTSSGGLLIAPAYTTPVVAHGERTPPKAVAPSPVPVLVPAGPAGEAPLPEGTATDMPSEPRDARARASAVQPRPAADASARGTGAPPVHPSSAPTASAMSPLAAELSTLSRARLAQSARAPAQALVELDEYERLPRPHVLEGEASLLRMEAWIQVGRQAEASQLAREYLRTHPGTPHRSRLQEIASGE